MSASERAERRARRLVRLYPRAWRARYGEEFTQFLIDDLADRPRSPARTADVLRSGVMARLARAGLADDTLMETHQQVRAGLGAVSLAVSTFLAVGIALWSQLTIGWQWSEPSVPATRTAMLVMSGTMLVFVLLAVLAVTPLAWILCRELARMPRLELVSPLIAGTIGSIVLIVGAVHFGHGWPGTGGHPWAGRDIVPGAVARFCWAATLWMNAYWAHPSALASFPASEIAWMIASPVALTAALTGAAKTVRRLPLGARLIRYEAWLGLTAGVAMGAFLAGAGSWIITGGSAPRGLFRVGAIDLIGLVLMRSRHADRGASQPRDGRQPDARRSWLDAPPSPRVRGRRIPRRRLGRL
jgi:hypothetical protein